MSQSIVKKLTEEANQLVNERLQESDRRLVDLCHQLQECKTPEGDVLILDAIEHEFYST